MSSIFFGEVSVKIWSIFQSSCFLLLSFKSSLYILDNRCIFCKYFPSVCVFPSHLLDIVFHRSEVLNFNEVQLINFFLDDAFDVLSKKSLLYLRSSRFSLMLFFWAGVRSMSGFIFLHVDIQLFQHQLLKTVFAPLYCLCSFVKDQFTTLHGSIFWALYSVPMTYLSILSPVSHCLDYYSFIVSLEVG